MNKYNAVVTREVLLKYSVPVAETINNRIIGYTPILEAYDLDNNAGFFIRLDIERPSGIYLTYSEAYDLVKNKGVKNENK